MRDEGRFFILGYRFNEIRWQKELLYILLFASLFGVITFLPTILIEHASNVRAIELCVLAYRDSGLPEADARIAALKEWNNPAKVEAFVRKYYDHPDLVDEYTLKYFHIQQ